MFKKAIATLTMLAPVTVLAGTMGCAPGNVTVPCPEKRWDLGVTALYLKPRVDADMGYEPLLNNPPAIQFHTLGHEWDWGYRINGSYHFGHGNDISMDWTHFQDTSLNYFNIAPGTPTAFWLNNQLDQVNLVLGQHINSSERHSFRLFGGLQAAQIKNNWNNYFSILTVIPGGPTAVTLRDFVQERKFTGVGATMGTDYSYAVGHGLSLTATGQMALLVGSTRTNYRLTLPQAVPGVVLTNVYGSKRAIVPELEVKTGVNYAYPSTHGTFNLKAGYQWMNYFNALQNLVIRGALRGFSNSDQGYDGVYLGVHFVSNAV